MKIFFQIIVALFIINISFAQTNYYVSPAGSDVNDGSQANPWATIEYAVNNVSNPSVDGIIINISGGIYDLSNDQIDIDRNFANLTLMGEGIDQTIIQAATDTMSSYSRVIKVYPGNNALITNMTIRYGRTLSIDRDGGGILNQGILVIDHCNVTNNWCNRNSLEAGIGGGLANDNGNLTIWNSTISYNTGSANGQGGGIGSRNGTLNIYNSTISYNVARLTAGGIFVASSGANAFFNLENSTIYGNTATTAYGGIRITIFGTQPSSFNVTTNMNGCTVFNNSTLGVRGGIGLSVPSNFNIKNSIVAGNVPSNLSGVDGSGIIVTSGGFNIFQSIDDVTINGATNNGIGLDPLLLPLADNNSTNGTKSCATEVGSPAIDAIPGGNGAPLLDQRGAIRNDAYDIGAYEWWPDSELPVELIAFTAKVIKNEVILNWKTATELNNYGFGIERQVGNLQSTVGKWEKIGFVNGNGNSNSPKSYAFIDNNPNGGSKFLYRLKQVDNDGQFEYSNVIEVEVNPTEFALFQNYPNPFNPSTIIKFQLPKESNVVIKVYDILGTEVMELLNDQKVAGIYELELKMENYSSGTYIYRIFVFDPSLSSNQTFIQANKLVLLK